MPTYVVTLTRTVEVVLESITARDEESAQEKAEKLADRLHIAVTQTGRPIDFAVEDDGEWDVGSAEESD